jgi:glycosyltransferase involved in cell wall biosynthesis
MNSAHRIIHISAYALRGGCEKNCFYFIRGSGNYEHEVVVLGQEGPMSSEWETVGAVVNHLDILRLDVFTFRAALKKFLAGRKANFAICWTTIRLPMQLNALAGIALQVRVHLGNPLGRNYSTAKDIVLQWLFPARKNVKMIACSRHVEVSHSRSRYFQKFTRRVSLNPVEIPQTVKAGRQLMQGFRLGMVARLDPIKDHRTIIQGCKIIKRAIPDVSLHLVGDGVLRHELEQLVAECGLKENVWFHGDVSNVYEYLNNWHIFVYSTTDLEGLGMAVEEAMANAMPCVLSDQPMLRELAPTENLVQWFRPFDAQSFADAVIHLYKDRTRCEELGQNAFEHATKQFGVSRFVTDYLSDE